MSMPKTLTDIVYFKIRNDIIHGDLLPGSKLKIEPLRKRYDIGASPIREALSRLCADGFVAIKGQQGFSVMEMSKEDLIDVTNSRVLIENEVLKLSILNGDDDWESKVVGSFHRLTKAAHSSDKDTNNNSEKYNKIFHDCLLSACESETLLKFYHILYDQHKRYRHLSREAIHIKRNIHNEHTDIYEAALNKDVKSALKANEIHIRKTAEIVMELERDEW
mgnify:CR=1 FL=1